MQDSVLDQPVVDQTGLPGKYDFTLTWTPGESEFAGFGDHIPTSVGDDATLPPDLFTALRSRPVGIEVEGCEGAGRRSSLTTLKNLPEN